MINFIKQCRCIYRKFVQDEITVYAAQASFFIVLSSLPFIMLVFSIIQFIPAVTQSDLLVLIAGILPKKGISFLETVLFDLYKASPAAILSVTTIAALWSAARGMMGIERGLNRITGCTKRRNYIYSRIVNSGYTIIFIIVCIMSLILLVFGNSIQSLFFKLFPIFRHLSLLFILLRAAFALGILVVFFVLLYTFLPYEKMALRHQIPGAVFSTFSWIIFSFGFSVYFTHFSRYPYMYGSLGAVMILMLWLYFCICILFFGAEINKYLTEQKTNRGF